MAMIQVEGGGTSFGDNDDWERRRANTAASNMTLGTGRLRGQCLFMSGSSNNLLFYMEEHITTGIVGFAFRADADGGLSNFFMIQFEDNSVIQCSLRVIANGSLEMYTGATTIIEQGRPGIIQPKQWHYIEVKVEIDAAGDYEVRVDGQTELSGTSEDLQQSANATFNMCRFRKDLDWNPQYSDMVFMDDSGLTLNDFIGDVEVETTIPDGDGNRTDFTPSTGSNWENVDDGTSPDDDSTYNHDTVVGTDDLYTHAALQATQVDTVFGVSVRNHMRKEEAGYRTGRALVRSNVSEDQGTTIPISGTFRYYDGWFELDPDGAAAWDEAAVNAAEFGVEIVA